jgi:hypothetical protein
MSQFLCESFAGWNVPEKLDPLRVLPRSLLRTPNSINTALHNKALVRSTLQEFAFSPDRVQRFADGIWRSTLYLVCDEYGEILLISDEPAASVPKGGVISAQLTVLAALPAFRVKGPHRRFYHVLQLVTSRPDAVSTMPLALTLTQRQLNDGSPFALSDVESKFDVPMSRVGFEPLPSNIPISG